MCQAFRAKYGSGTLLWEMGVEPLWELVYLTGHMKNQQLNTGYLTFEKSEDTSLRAVFNPHRTKVVNQYPHLKVAELFEPGTRRWDESIVGSLFDQETAEWILKITPLPEPSKDRLFWKFTTSDEFTVKSAYRVLIPGPP